MTTEQQPIWIISGSKNLTNYVLEENIKIKFPIIEAFDNIFLYIKFTFLMNILLLSTNENKKLSIFLTQMK